MRLILPKMNEESYLVIVGGGLDWNWIRVGLEYD
jgi:hypothetical protein